MRKRRIRRSTSDNELLNPRSVDLPENQLNKPDTSRKRRRRGSRSSDLLDSPSIDSADQENPENPENQLNSEDFLTAPPQTARLLVDDTNLIRSDLLEDDHHSDLAESYYSDDTHDWGGDSDHISNDYWHFLGQYE